MSEVIGKKRRSGTWIDFEVVSGLGLTDQEKILYSMVFHLSKRNKGCTASNAYFAKKMEKSEKAISEAISRMARKGVIRVHLTKTKNGTERVMYANVKKPTPQTITEATPQEVEPTPQIMTNNPQIVDTTPQDKECMHSTEYGGDIKGIKEEHKKEIEKESLSQSDELSWLNVSDKAKDLILRDWGEYDHVPEKEKLKLLQWESFQKNHSPKVVLEMIQKLIFIRRSKKFETDTFWQSRPINISSAYSYKDHIKNTYEALQRLPDSNVVQIKKESAPLSAAKQREITKPSYDSFEDWASTKLTRSSMGIIRNVLTPDELPESLRMIYDKFVNEERGTPVLHSRVRKEAV
ncbi:helix-turn-helix domain-containing protein (plasmid) [Leptospira sp. WS92.C1]